MSSIWLEKKKTCYRVLWDFKILEWERGWRYINLLSYHTLEGTWSRAKDVYLQPLKRKLSSRQDTLQTISIGVDLLFFFLLILHPPKLMGKNMIAKHFAWSISIWFKILWFPVKCISLLLILHLTARNQNCK